MPKSCAYDPESIDLYLGMTHKKNRFQILLFMSLCYSRFQFFSELLSRNNSFYTLGFFWTKMNPQKIQDVEEMKRRSNILKMYIASFFNSPDVLHFL